MLAPVAVLASLLGLFFATFALLGARIARIWDFVFAFAGFAMNGVLLWGVLFTPPRRPGCSPKFVCIANLKPVEGAKATWALEHHKTTNDIAADSDFFGTNAYIRIKPQCPSGGSYKIGTVDQKTTCSIPGHTL